MLNLTNHQNKLPFLISPDYNLKILIDTGSTKSFVNPVIAKKYFKKDIKKDPYHISSAHGTSFEQFSTIIPCSKLFNVKNCNLKFHIFEFHKYFDCLIGLDHLQHLKASVDLNKSTLTTPNVVLKIHYRSTDALANSISINPNCEQIIEINIANVTNGEVVIPQIKVDKLVIPQCVTTVKNHKAICSVVNPTESCFSLTCNRPITVENFENYNHKIEENLNIFDTEKLKFDLSLIRTDHMNPEEKATISKLIREYHDLFHLENNKLTFTNQIKHKIRTTDEIPVYTKSYRFPEIHKKEVETQINKMLAQNIIRPSNSAWSSPLWVIPKKLDSSGKQKWRIVIDYRRLNAKTIGDRYPLPNIIDLLDKLGRCLYFTTLDLASGFHQIEMDPEDIPKTAFNCLNNHFEFLRMPFGLKGAPSTFERCMDNVLRGVENTAVYLDDIIVFSSSLQEHIIALKEVFERLRKANFKLQLDKCEFLQREVKYLGHVVTSEGVKPNPDKVIAIKKYPLPKNSKQLKGFLGLLGYYRRFIKDFARLTKPLTKCLKKDAIINVNDQEYVRCFNMCKDILMNEPVLQYPDFAKPFILTTDASNVSVAGILAQEFAPGVELPVAYCSRTLNESELNYSTIEKELLAIVYATKYFRPYIFGRKFKIFCDHKPLQWLFSLKEPNSKLIRWRLKLEEYDFDIVYKKGSLNTNADALSRVEINMKETIENSDGIFDYMKNFNKKLEDLKLNKETEDIIEIDDSDNSSVIVQIDDSEDSQNLDIDNEENDTIHSNENNPIFNIPISESPVNCGKNQIIISEVDFEPATPSVIRLFTDKQRYLVQFSKNNYVKEIIDFIKTYVVPKVKYYLYFENFSYEKFCSTMQKYFKNSEIDFVRCTSKLIDVTEEDEMLQTISNYHESKANHRGIDETETRIKNIYYWPNLRKSIQNYINNCEICQLAKYDRKPLKLKFNITPTAVRPFQIVHIDTISLEKTKFLTIVDSFSKYAQAYKLNSAQGIEVVNCLVKYFSHHCIPEEIVSDNGLEFKNSVLTELLALHKIKLHFISSQHPNSNGICERFHSTLIEHIRLFNNQKEYENDSIEMKVNYAVLAYNNTMHSATKLKPYEIVNGHFENNSPFSLDLEKQMLSNYISDHKDKMKILYKNLNQKLQQSKEKIIGKANENKEEVPEIPETVHVKNLQKQSKTKNKFKIEKIETLNPRLKIANIIPRHFNTHSKIHLSNIKRPRKFTYKTKHVTGSSSTSDSEQKSKI